MEPFVEKILREKDLPTMPPPEERHIKISMMSFEGKTIGEIRAEYPKTSVKMIGTSIRTVRDAMRRGAPPDEVKAVFPALVKEQQDIGSGKVIKRDTVMSKALTKITTNLRAVHFTNVRDFIETVKQQFAPIGVPLLVQNIIEGAERGDSEMIKLGTQIFDLTPKGTGKSGKVEPSAGKGPVKSTDPSRRVAYFEGLVRKAHSKLGIVTPAAATIEDVPDDEEEEDDKDNG